MVAKEQALEALDECMRGGGGYGNAIVPQVGAEFVSAFMEAQQ